MKLTRKQELALINYGLSKLLEELVPVRETKPRKTASTKKRKWSKEQHEKFAKTMKAVWRKKRAANG